MHSDAVRGHKRATHRRIKPTNGRRLQSLHFLFNQLLFSPESVPDVSSDTSQWVWRHCAWQRHSYTAASRLPRRRHKCLGKPFRKALRDEDPVSRPQAGAHLPIPSSWEDFEVYSLRDETLQNSQSLFGGCLLSLLQLSLPWMMPQGCNIKLLEGVVTEKVLSWKTGWFYGCI